jgi:hypothetical protein
MGFIATDCPAQNSKISSSAVLGKAPNQPMESHSPTAICFL